MQSQVQSFSRDLAFTRIRIRHLLQIRKRKYFDDYQRFFCDILGLDLWIAFTYASLMFATTMNGVGHVLNRIEYFLFVLLFVILIFSIMFGTVYSSTNICEDPEDFLFCKSGTSMIELYGNFFRNVEYSYFYVSASGVLLDPRREGNNDLDEMDPKNSYYQKWAAALASFEDKRVIDENGVFVSKFWSNFMRRCTCSIIFPCWLLLGFVSAGYFWPPQARVGLLFAKAEKENRSPTEETSASMKQLQTEILTANQTIYTRFGTTEASMKHLNTKIDQLVFEMKQLKPVNEEPKKVDSSYKKSETPEMKTELEDIKKILRSLSKKS